jgi:hypothetical protein
MKRNRLSQDPHTLGMPFGPSSHPRERNNQETASDKLTLAFEDSKSLAISSSDGSPPAVTSDAKVNVQYVSLLLVGAMVRMDATIDKAFVRAGGHHDPLPLLRWVEMNSVIGGGGNLHLRWVVKDPDVLRFNKSMTYYAFVSKGK